MGVRVRVRGTVRVTVTVRVRVRGTVPLAPLAHARGPALQHLCVRGAAVAHAEHAAVAPGEGGGHLVRARVRVRVRVS